MDARSWINLPVHTERDSIRMEEESSLCSGTTLESESGASPRSSIPSDIESGSPNPNGGGWGQAVAAWSAATCPTSGSGTIFQDHVITFDMTLCGDWAGAAFPGNGCSGTCADAVANPSNFDNAIWKVKSVTVYQQSS